MRLKASAKNLLLPNVTLNTMISANKEYFLITDDDDDDGPEWESKPMEQIIQVKCEDEDGEKCKPLKMRFVKSSSKRKIKSEDEKADTKSADHDQEDFIKGTHRVLQSISICLLTLIKIPALFMGLEILTKMGM